MRPSKAPARENSNFEYFVKQAEEAEARKAQNNNNNNTNNNNANNNNKSEEPSVNMAKSKSMPRVESKWGIFDPPAKKGTMRRLDGASLMGGGGANNANNAIIERHLAEDDDTLKVFMQAWNMLDTFEGIIFFFLSFVFLFFFFPFLARICSIAHFILSLP